MAKIVEMPKLSDTMEEGRIARWLKKEGETVREGDLLLEIETDKATMEYPSPDGGVLLKILHGDGATVPLRSPIGVLGAAGEAFDLAQLTTSVKGAPSAGGQKKSPSSGQGETAAPASTPAFANSLPDERSERIKASPLAKKMAKAAGIDLQSLQGKGSGPHGRIIAADITAKGAASPVKGQSVRSGVSQKIELSMMRKTIAKRLVGAKNNAPHFYLNVSADMGAILEWREQLNQEPQYKNDPLKKVSVNDLIILAVSRALRHHPMVNASWDEDAIIQHHQVHVAMAVALPQGLITPVLWDTDTLSARDIAVLTKTLGNKAKEGKLDPSEYSGGTFTISNLGMVGVESFTAIINPPQACILAVGAVMPVPWVAPSSGAIVVQKRVQLTLSCDHRVVDGMVGAQFLQTLVAYLETPLKMLA